MRILFTGAAPWVNSGYGKPGRYLYRRLIQMGHEIGLCCFFGWRGAVTGVSVGDNGEEITIFPPAREWLFNDIIQYQTALFEADVVISNQDAWALQGWGGRGFTWCPWMPVDTDPVSVPTLEAIEGCYAPLAYSEWGRDQLRANGWPTARHIPFGVDLEVHRPMVQEMARKAAGLPVDGLIVGMVAANSSYPSRKSFPEVLLAWKRWVDGGGEGLLYLHTTLTPKRGREHGLEMQRVLETLGLPWSTLSDPDQEHKAAARVMFADQLALWNGAYSDEHLAEFYSSFDVLLSPSMSEGFGIPILEAQACGVPVVTQNTTSMPEITFSGMCLEPVQRAWDNQGGWRGVADVGAIVGAIDWAWQMRGATEGREHYRRKARASVERFGWDRVVEDYWVPLLEELEC